MSEYHRAALKCESPQALRDISQRNSQVILGKGCSDLAGACYESLPALFSKQLRARKSTLNSDISSAACRVLLFGVLEWGDPQHRGNKRQEHTDGAVQFILLWEPGEMNPRENGPDPWTVYPWERWARGDHRCGRKEVKAGAGLSRERDRSNCLLLGDNEVLINTFGSKVWVWDVGQGVPAGSFEANDRSETR